MTLCLWAEIRLCQGLPAQEQLRVNGTLLSQRQFRAQSCTAAFAPCWPAVSLADPSWFLCFAVGSLRFADAVVVVVSFVFVVVANPSQKWMHSRVLCKTCCASSHPQVWQYFIYFSFIWLSQILEKWCLMSFHRAMKRWWKSYRFQCKGIKH